MNRTSALSRDEVSLLWILSVELSRLRDVLANAQMIGTFADAKSSRHPILAFAFSRLPGAVIESLLLRLAEALEYLNRAALLFLQTPLMKKQGREMRAEDPDFQLLLELRNYRVAHSVNLRSQADLAYEKMKLRYSDAYEFINVVLDKIEVLIEELDAAGLFEPREGLVAGYDMVPRFSEAELRTLVEAANHIMEPEGIAA